MVLSCMKTQYLDRATVHLLEPDTSKSPVLVCSLLPLPLPLRCVPLSLWLYFPPFLPPLQPEELTLLLIKLRRQQAELNSIREHTVAQLMQLNMDGDNPKVRPPEMPLQACVLAFAVYAIFTNFHYPSGSRGIFFFGAHTHADLRKKDATVGIFSVKDYALV